ncbi:S1C family serine protease [Thalassomonas sp. M1454]|uniref:S1C family serine protease n=1 Tax=Thalassomonas sp. M1454 TaxID=2594477 RepID=UPI0011805F32|nr:trypsin-like peptidase domain-containing protein [Thalassomonas sp. M1454]TRX54555.1 trypsin-like serine protease [Thalassomonas sp. M1454]
MLRNFILTLLIVLPISASAADSVKQLFKKVNNGVVELHVTSIASPKPGQVSYKETTQNSLGSGALINKTGRILTAAHVVGKATNIKVIFNDGSTTSGHVVWVDTLIDLAMIQARKVPSSIEPLKLADKGGYTIGEQVIAIGAPYGVSHSLSVGYLSGIRDRDEIPGTSIKPRLLQTDASINQGNSGGPLFNLDGDIIGIVSHILSKSGGSNGLGFVVSVDTVREVMDSSPGNFSGFIPHLLRPNEAKAINNQYGHGMLVQHVIPGTLAHKLGFQGGYLNVIIGRTPVLLGGDIVVKVDGVALKDLASAMKIRQRLSEVNKGEKIVFEYLRNGEEKEVTWLVD